MPLPLVWQRHFESKLYLFIGCASNLASTGSVTSMGRQITGHIVAGDLNVLAVVTHDTCVPGRRSATHRTWRRIDI